VPALGYLSVYAARDLRSGETKMSKNKAVVGSPVPAGALGDKRKVIKGALGPEVVLGPALVFTDKNIDQYDF
jgi:hypothetical protein